MLFGAERILRIGQAATLAASVAAAATLSSADQWRPLPLFISLLAVAVLSDLFRIRVKQMWITGSFLAIVVATILLGPAPAVAIGILTACSDAVSRWRGLGTALSNIATFAAFPLVGSLLCQAVDAPAMAAAEDALVVPLVVVVFMLTNALNFLLVAIDVRVTDGHRVGAMFREVYLAVAPVEFAVSLLAAVVVLGYYLLGAGAIALLAVIALTFQYLIRIVWESVQREEALQRRTRELSSLQVGLLTTVLQTLSLRDAMTARHSAAVARYSREMAKELGLSDIEQDLVHTAGLLHDIGKFIFPDSILFAARGLTDDEFNIVRKHPEQGARLVERIEGYGPVAEIIRAHHERVDGQGYPRRLVHHQIPLASRIISIADTYDVMTSRDSYRSTVSSDVAIAELRRVSGTQLDGTIVEVFIHLLQSRGVQFRHGDDADFEAELSFERRVTDYARPREMVA